MNVQSHIGCICFPIVVDGRGAQQRRQVARLMNIALTVNAGCSTALPAPQLCHISDHHQFPHIFSVSHASTYIEGVLLGIYGVCTS